MDSKTLSFNVGALLANEVTEERDLQAENAHFPILVTPSGIVIEVRLLHL